MSKESYLLDTSVFVRFIAIDDVQQPSVQRAIAKITSAGGTLSFTPQVSRESWAVLTRPTDVNGYGFSASFARAALNDVSAIFSFLADTPEIYKCWIDLVTKHEIRGRQVHDAYHAAAMQVHGISRVLTLDRRDFSRYKGIEVVYPDGV